MGKMLEMRELTKWVFAPFCAAVFLVCSMNVCVYGQTLVFDNSVVQAGGSAGNTQGGVVFAIPTHASQVQNPQIRLVQSHTVIPYQPENPPPNFTPGLGLGSGTGSTTTNPSSALPPTTADSTFDPYSTSSGSNYGSSSNSSAFTKYFEDTFPDQSKKVMRRFIERVSLEYTFIPRGKDLNGFGYSEVAYQTEFAFPCRFLPDQSAVYLVPGVDLVWFDGPYGPPINYYNVSPNAFGAYMEIGMMPRITENFGIDAWGSVGLYSDFQKVDTDAVRFEGTISAIIGMTKELDGVLGIDYVNRNRIKLLPRIGVIWKPNNLVEWKLVFPNPRLTRYITKVNNIDWAFYIEGEYGGGAWVINDNWFGPMKFDYNDIRCGIGIEFKNQYSFKGFFEVGGAFARELYSHETAWCKPSSTIYLKTGFRF